MITLQSLALLAALSNPGQPVLLDFYADWCGPCRTMDPVVRRLIAEGYAVRKVNIDHEKQLTRKYRVSAVPTFVLTVDGQEVSRVTGPTGYSQLAAMFRSKKPPNAQVVANESQARATPDAPKNPPPTPGTDPRARAMQATVRLRVEDPKGNSFGTGTIIDMHGAEALIVTCGHIFRDSGGQGKILVDLFAPGTAGPVQGQLIAYNLEQDVALVAIRPGVKVTPVPVPPKTHQVRIGDRAFSVGCDHGNDPTLHETQVTAIDKYVMPSNIVAAGEPAIGRSGGGLFAANGQLIGVCNLASPTDREGIYAAASLVRENLDNSGLAAIYQRNAPQIASTRTPPSPPASARVPSHQTPTMPKTMPRSPLDDSRSAPVAPLAVPRHEPRTVDERGHLADDTEVICIVRSKSNPRGRNQVIFLDRPPQDLLNRLAMESRSGRTLDPVVVEASSSDASIASRPSRTSSAGQRGGPVVRAQSDN